MDGCEHIASVLKLSNQIRRKMNYVTNYTGTQTHILSFILNAYKTREIYQKDLEQEFNTCGASISNTLKKLEKEGLVVREHVPDDDRLKRVVPTDLAMEKKEQVDHLIGLLEEQMIKGITLQKLQIFLEVSEQMLQNMSEE